MKKDKWVWMPHAGHFILGDKCKFHLSTYVGKYIVSTVGELMGSDSSQHIQAQIHNPAWYAMHKHLQGDSFESAYFNKFGYQDIGADRKYETMVFKAKKGQECCPWIQKSGESEDFDSYNTDKEAREGHMKMCNKWSKV